MTVPGPPIAYPVTMVERDITGRTPAIRETSIWMVNRHKASRLKKTGSPHRRRRLIFAKVDFTVGEIKDDVEL